MPPLGASWRLRVRYRHGRNSQGRSYTLDPYALVNKAGAWCLDADHCTEPTLFRTDRALSAAILDQPARRRAGLELADIWDTLRRVIDDIPAPLLVTVSVRREILGKFLRIRQADLAGPPPADPAPGTGHQPDRVQVDPRFPSLGAAEIPLDFGTDGEVLTPPNSARPWPARRPTPTPATPPTRNTGRLPPADQRVYPSPKPITPGPTLATQQHPFWATSPAKPDRPSSLNVTIRSLFLEAYETPETAPGCSRSSSAE